MIRRPPAVYVVVIGAILTVTGIVLIVLPGPGLLLALVGVLVMISGSLLVYTDRRAERRANPTPDSDGPGPTTGPGSTGR